ncbi:50S ribosomal protein L3 [Candidatus Azambacteria bacterium RIFCSPHIGHO2_01_FULL_44_55]|uniref:Large ribosomal subunit protein uL3 n=1 Tax=Candidatus Azambacteria bacterium RIFCSPLOWO2_02_FULL_44_14 TaxID=1797306 RepID=A0A1F5CBE6_9BACT|nr:MAG: 50S ribosomal protein L3 [Candidatus Azambacteria bacterium RIFCSPLOWO2_01_FULL_44_84]OGD32737.1 MAG: 50S ribosomal protein L3 [Candidatus Azambacteria bacterium RIFCSPHIGHO2_02_FULL_45_18]OGD40190.1 MAG: 50S ribosomal protein L3 [Candidatus Azambacteria bacterium RIFCSPLOWO2_02_FULL_44_14]OGD41722.1 MAG: 50S ribosomal protein L3 [Candidatus Azambacteria bacterium RIFCSPHIGHO2_01_FULL_44_55]
MKFILGKKLTMNQVFDETGRVTPVTYIEIEPNFVTQVKTQDKDGYSALQVGTTKTKKVSKARAGHLQKISNLNSQISNLRDLKEFRMSGEEAKNFKTGDKSEADTFAQGDTVTVIGVSKGKGFQGVVKRHGFAGGPASHGQKDRHRAPGSIGSSFPEHVMKGMRMAGRMGGEKITVKNLKVISVDKENQLIALSGAVPGRKGSLVIIKG